MVLWSYVVYAALFGFLIGMVTMGLLVSKK